MSGVQSAGPSPHGGGAAPSTRPSERSLYILRLASYGLTNEEIAPRVGLRPAGVKDALLDCTHKMRTNSVAEAVAVAYLRAWMPFESRRPPALTVRQQQVLEGMAAGWTNAEIGEALYLSLESVKSHARLVLAKFGARDRAHAVGAACRSGLLPAVFLEEKEAAA